MVCRRARRRKTGHVYILQMTEQRHRELKSGSISEVPRKKVSVQVRKRNAPWRRRPTPLRPRRRTHCAVLLREEAFLAVPFRTVLSGKKPPEARGGSGTCRKSKSS